LINISFSWTIAFHLAAASSTDLSDTNYMSSEIALWLRVVSERDT